MRENNDYFENIKIKGAKLEKNKKNRNNSKSAFQDIDFKKSLGQNFLSDKNLLNSIVKIANISDEDVVLEIGAGAGSLTAVLAKFAKKVISYEIDRSLTDILLNLKSNNSNLEIVFEDFMKADINYLFQENQRIKVVANIPYYITTPIIFKLLDFSNNIDLMLFMVQKEVALRFASKEGKKDYGITSIILQSIADVSYEKTVAKECFTPMPKVDSALVKIELRKDKFNILDFEFFTKLIHTSFSMRRKTLINNLTKSFDFSKEYLIENLKKLGYSETVRPEEISVENYVKLSNILKNKK
ncbi:MAG: ribosomal RNA small subunit methyltransferase A [Clostridia bacterium]|nr:ribosomal RNA small subunit methyltransferase A [Clostridia bacterium]